MNAVTNITTIQIMNTARGPEFAFSIKSLFISRTAKLLFGNVDVYNTSEYFLRLGKMEDQCVASGSKTVSLRVCLHGTRGLGVTRQSGVTRLFK